MSEKTTSPTYFGGLNMLRAFCALAIIVYHTSLSFQDKMPSMVKMFLHNLTLGVDMFFIISGFIIIYLLLVEKQTTNKIDFIKFYIRRALRIFPLYFLVVGIAYLIYHNSNPTIDFSKYAYFASNFWMIAKNDWTVGILNPLWSLCIEEHFYLVIPLLIYITPLKRVNLVLIGAVAVSILFRIYACHTVQYNWMTIYCHTLSRCDLMAIGGLIAYYTQRNTAPHNTLYTISSTIMYAALGQLILLMCILDFSDFTTQPFAVFKKYLFVVPMVVLFVGFVLNKDTQNTLIEGLKSNKILNYLGKISFGLYMYHSGVGELVGKIGFMTKYFAVYMPAVIVLTVVVAALSYEFFEKQILKFKTPFEVNK